MPKHAHVLRRFGIASIAILGLIVGGLAVPAVADELPTEPPMSEIVAPSDAPDVAIEPVEADGVPVDQEPVDQAPAEDAGQTIDSASSLMAASSAAAELSLSKSTGLNRTGETIDVTGSGLADGTVYLQVGWVKPDTWRPSTGGVSNVDRKGLGAPIVQAVAGGGFTASVAIPSAATMVAPDGAVLAVFTVGAHGVVNADQEAYAAVAFADPLELALSKSDGIARTGETIDVTGSGLADGTVYLQVGWVKPDTWRPSTGGVSNVDRKGLGAPIVQAVAGGGFTASVAIPSAATMVAPDGAVLAVFTVGAHGVVNAAQEVYAPIAFAAEAPAIRVFAADAATELTSSSPVYAGDRIVVKGTGFDTTGSLGVRPPLAGQPAGAYAVFGNFSPVWQPSAGAASATRKIDSSAQKWALPQVSFDAVGGSANPAYVLMAADGSFTAEITVKAPTANAANGVFGVYTYAGSGATNAATELAFPLNYLGSRPATTTTTTLSTSASTLTLGGSVTLTATVTPADAAGSVRFTEGTTILEMTPVSAGSASIAVSPGVGGHSYQAQFVPTDASAHAASTSSAIAVQVDPAAELSSGSLSWAIRASFNQYVVTTAGGTISLSDGASSLGGGFRFPQTTGGDWSPTTQLGTVSFAGSVHYTGHGGALDVTFANPAIVIDSATSATLYLNGTAFASLNLGAASKSVGAGGDVTWSGVPAVLTSGGAASFAGFYNAGDPLESLTFTAGSAASGIGGGTVVVAAAQSTPPRTPAATPPATTGATPDKARYEAGGQVTIKAGGFQPNETGILVVIYSDPIVLSHNATADASGVVTWVGYLPAGLTGSHTLTLQGSIDVGAPITISAVRTPAAVGACTIDEATLTWGFKESFRSYISGTIANGEWTVADGAAYETPSFSWEGSGTFDPDGENGDLAFSGSVRFTGHDGALDTTIADPRIVVSDGEAVLLLDVSGATREGQETSVTGIEFAELDLAAATVELADGVLTLSGIPAVLAEAGAAAFGTYSAGEALDPLSLTLAIPADCGESRGEAAGPEAQSVAGGAPASPDLTWIWWVVGGVLLLGIIVTVAIVLARRRAA